MPRAKKAAGPKKVAKKAAAPAKKKPAVSSSAVLKAQESVDQQKALL